MIEISAGALAQCPCLRPKALPRLTQARFLARASRWYGALTVPTMLIPYRKKIYIGKLSHSADPPFVIQRGNVGFQYYGLHLTPLENHWFQTPGAEHGEVQPGAEHGEVQPGAEQGEVQTPGAVNSQLTSASASASAST